MKIRKKTSLRIFANLVANKNQLIKFVKNLNKKQKVKEKNERIYNYNYLIILNDKFLYMYVLTFWFFFIFFLSGSSEMAQKLHNKFYNWKTLKNFKSK